MIYRVKTPATSANLGVGFDTLGIALSLYNEFQFESSHDDTFIGFQARYQNKKYNLVYKAYAAFFKTYGKGSYQAVKMTLIKQDIPISRGLGSSASLILAGVFASNHLHQIHVSFDDCVSFAATFEGHPDNVYACAYGGLISVIKQEDKYIHQALEVSDKLHFHLLIPREKGYTKKLREALPKHVSLIDAVHNSSRMSVLPAAMKQGDMNLLKVVLDDRLHEPYRIPRLPNQDIINHLKEKYLILISGSGPTLFIITDDQKLSLDEQELEGHSYRVVSVSLGLIEEHL